MANFSTLLDAEGHFADLSVYTLREQINFLRDFRGTSDHTLTAYRSLDEVPFGTVPVGSIDFVEAVLKRDHGIERVPPLQLPYPLTVPKMAIRRVFTITGVSEIPKGDWFVKPLERYKGNPPFRSKGEITLSGKYFISEYVDFEAEWRVFVFRDEILGVRQYLGDYDRHFNSDRLKTFVRVLEEYRRASYAAVRIPIAYTLDIGLMRYKGRTFTVPVEMHHFYSCGLYGFGHTSLPSMYSATYYELVRTFSTSDKSRDFLSRTIV
jgi:hypothetical protein